MHVIARVLAATSLWFALLLPAPAFASPFDGRPTSAADSATAPNVPALHVFNELRRDAARRLTAATEDLAHHPFGPTFALALLFAFGYGVIHAAGPGHGKSVVASHFLSRDASLASGFRLSLWIAVTHVASAIGVVAVAALLLGRSVPSLEDERATQLVSYGILTLLGVVLLVQTARGGRFAAHSCADHGHEHDHSHEHQADGRDRTTGLLAVAAGAVPCTGSLLVLAYAVANGFYLIGFALILAIGAGMALTTAAFGLVARAMRLRILKQPRAGEERVRRRAAIALAGPLLVIASGGTLFVLAYLGA
jgi:ABC-type nickel/cobalt efflux system permease component RcnA